MGRDLVIQELSVVILGRNHNPTILNPDFLKYNEIIASDWELQGPPICVEPMAQVHFKNKVTITAQFDKITFHENISEKTAQEILVPEVAHRYINKLPHVEYLAVGINPTGHIVIEGEDDASNNFLAERFIAPGLWQTLGDSSVKASFKFTYTFGDMVCTLGFEAKPLKLSDEKSIQVISIASNFHHPLVGDDRNNRLIDLDGILEKWEEALDLYRDLVGKILIGAGD